MSSGHGGGRSGSGRKPIDRPPLVKITIRVAAEHLKWLRRPPCGVSRQVRDLIDERIRLDRGAG